MNWIRFLLFIAALTTSFSCFDDPALSASATQSGEKQIKRKSAAPAPIANPTLAPATPKPDSPIDYGDRFPKVLSVRAKHLTNEQWQFSVTLSSKYDTQKRYADAWRVLDEKDRQLGIRVLLHDHASEQPFTRSQTIKVPADTSVVFIEGRDQLNGWSHQRFAFEIP